MINVKAIIYEALSKEFDNVSDVYPNVFEDDTTFPIIVYVEEDNKGHDYVDDNIECMTYLRYAIHIFDFDSTSQSAIDIDEIMSSFCFRRTSCSDVPEPNQLRHKQMRFECLIDTQTLETYSVR